MKKSNNTETMFHYQLEIHYLLLNDSSKQISHSIPFFNCNHRKAREEALEHCESWIDVLLQDLGRSRTTRKEDFKLLKTKFEFSAIIYLIPGRKYSSYGKNFFSQIIYGVNSGLCPSTFLHGLRTESKYLQYLCKKAKTDGFDLNAPNGNELLPIPIPLKVMEDYLKIETEKIMDEPMMKTLISKLSRSKGYL